VLCDDAPAACRLEPIRSRRAPGTSPGVRLCCLSATTVGLRVCPCSVTCAGTAEYQDSSRTLKTCPSREWSAQEQSQMLECQPVGRHGRESSTGTDAALPPPRLMGGGARWSRLWPPLLISRTATGTHAVEAWGAVFSSQELQLYIFVIRSWAVRYLFCLDIPIPDSSGYVVSKFQLIWSTYTSLVYFTLFLGFRPPLYFWVVSHP